MASAAKYLSNVAKSATYVAVDAIKAYNPVIVDAVESNSELARSAYTSIRQYRTAIQRVSKAIAKSQVGEFAVDLKKNILEDLKSGNFYNREREHTAMESALANSDMGFSDDFDEFSVDFGGDEDFSVSDGDASNFDMIDAMDNVGDKASNAVNQVLVKTAEYQVEANRQSTIALITQQTKMHQMLQSSMSTMNQNIASVVNFNNEAMSTHIENSRIFYDTTQKQLNEQTSILKEMLDLQKKIFVPNKSHSVSNRITINDIFTTEGAINLADYFRYVQQNAKDNDMGISSMLESLQEAGGLKQISANPLGLLLSTVVQGVIPEVLKESMKSFNEALRGGMATALMNISKLEDSSSGILSTIGSLFGINPHTKKRLDTSKYNKEAVPWNGKDHKALTEVIPDLLGKIYSSISGSEQKIYDYETGRYVSKKKIKQQFEATQNMYVRNANTTLVPEIEKQLSQISFFDPKEREQFLKDLDQVMKQNFNRGEYFNPKDKSMNAQYYGLKGDKAEYNMKLMREMWNNIDVEKQLQANYDLIEAINSQNSYMKNLENSGDSIFLRLFDDSDDPIDNRKGKKAKERRKKTKDKAKQIKKGLMTPLYETSNKLDTVNNLLFEILKTVEKVGANVGNRYTLSEPELVYENASVNDFASTHTSRNRSRKSKDKKKKKSNSTSDDSDGSHISKVRRKDLEQTADLLIKELYGEKVSKNKYERIGITGGDNSTDIKRLVSATIDRGSRDDILKGMKTSNPELYKVMKRKLDQQKKSNEDAEAMEIVNALDEEYLNGNSSRDQIRYELDQLKKADPKLYARVMRLKNRKKKSKYSVSSITGIAHNNTNSNEATMSYGGDINLTRTQPSERSRARDSRFISDIRDADTAMGKIKAFFGGTKYLLESPAKFVGNVMKKADMRLYNVLFGMGTNDEFSITGKMMNGFDDWFENLKEKTSNTFEKIQDAILEVGIGDKVKTLFKNVFGVSIEVWSDEFKKAMFGNSNVTFGEGMQEVFSKGFKEIADGFKSFFGFGPKNKNKEEDPGYLYSAKTGWRDITSGRLNEKGKEKEERINTYNRIVREYNKANRNRHGSIWSSSNKKKRDKYDNYDDWDLDNAASGMRRVSKTGVVAVSEGELIVPPDLNPNNINRRERNEQSAISKFKEAYSGIDIPTFSSGGTTGEGETKKETDKKQAAHDIFDYLDDQLKTGRMSLEQIIDTINSYKKSDPELFKHLGKVSREKARKVKKENRYTHDDYEAGHENLAIRISDELSNMVSAILDSDIAKSITDKLDASIGQDAKDAAKDTVLNLHKYLPTMAAAGTTGMALSLMLGLAGGPLVGGAVGAGLALVKKSESVQKLLFGNQVTDEEGNTRRDGTGLLSKNLVSHIDKYFPAMSKGAIVGGIASILPFVPGGPVAGILVGSAVGFARTNEEVRRTFFGSEEKAEKMKEKIHKMAPKMAIGAAGMALAGPFGLTGNLLLGAGLGFVSDTEKFKQVLFGNEGLDGKRYGGIVGFVKDALEVPLEGLKNLFYKTTDWLKEDIFEPIKNALQPITQQISNMVTWVGDKIHDSIKTHIVHPIGKMVTNILKPFQKLGNTIIGTIFGAVRKLIASPFKLLQAFTNKLQEHQLGKVGASNNLTLSQRLQRREEIDRKRNKNIDVLNKAFNTDRFNKSRNKLQSTDAGRLDDFLNTASKEDLQNFYRVQQSIDPNSGKKISMKTLSKNFEKTLGLDRLLAAEQSGGFIIGDTAKEIRKAVRKGDFKAAKDAARRGFTDPERAEMMVKWLDNKEKEYAKLKETWEVSESKYKELVKKTGIKDINSRNAGRTVKNAIYERFGEDANATLSEQLAKDRENKEKSRMDDENKYRDKVKENLGGIKDELEEANKILTCIAFPNSAEAKKIIEEKMSWTHAGNGFIMKDSETTQESNVIDAATERARRKAERLAGKTSESVVTEHGIVKLDTNAQGEKIIDDTDSETRETIKRRDESSNTQKGILNKISNIGTSIKEAIFGTNDEETDGDEKHKKGILSSILGIAKAGLNIFGGKGLAAIGAVGAALTAFGVAGTNVQVKKRDENGKVIYGPDGQPVMETKILAEAIQDSVSHLWLGHDGTGETEGLWFKIKGFASEKLLPALQKLWLGDDLTGMVSGLWFNIKQLTTEHIIPSVTRGMNWFITNALPGILKTFVKTLPSLVGALLTGVTEVIGDAIKSILPWNNKGSQKGAQESPNKYNNNNLNISMANGSLAVGSNSTSTPSSSTTSNSSISNAISSNASSMGISLDNVQEKDSNSVIQEINNMDFSVDTGDSSSATVATTPTTSKSFSGSGSISASASTSSTSSTNNMQSYDTVYPDTEEVEEPVNASAVNTINNKTNNKVSENNNTNDKEIEKEIKNSVAYKNASPVTQRKILKQLVPIWNSPCGNYGTVQEILNSDVVVGSYTDEEGNEVEIHGYEILKYPQLAATMGLDTNLTEAERQENKELMGLDVKPKNWFTHALPRALLQGKRAGKGLRVVRAINNKAIWAIRKGIKYMPWVPGGKATKFALDTAVRGYNTVKNLPSYAVQGARHLSQNVMDHGFKGGLRQTATDAVSGVKRLKKGATEALSNTKTGKIVGKVTDKIKDKMATKGITKAKVLGKAKDKIGPLIKKFTEMTRKFFTSSKVVNKFVKGVKKLATTTSKKVSESAIKKVLKEAGEKIIERFSKSIVKAGAKVVAKIAKGISKYIPVVGQVASIAFLLTDFALGMKNADMIFGVLKPTFFERVVAGIVNAFVENLWFGMFFDANFVINTIVNLLEAIGVDMSNLRERQDEAEAARDKWNTEHETNLSVTEYIGKDKIGARIKRGLAKLNPFKKKEEKEAEAKVDKVEQEIEKKEEKTATQKINEYNTSEVELGSEEELTDESQTYASAVERVSSLDTGIEEGSGVVTSDSETETTPTATEYSKVRKIHNTPTMEYKDRSFISDQNQKLLKEEKEKLNNDIPKMIKRTKDTIANYLGLDSSEMDRNNPGKDKYNVDKNGPKSFMKNVIKMWSRISTLTSPITGKLPGTIFSAMKGLSKFLSVNFGFSDPDEDIGIAEVANDKQYVEKRANVIAQNSSFATMLSGITGSNSASVTKQSTSRRSSSSPGSSDNKVTSAATRSRSSKGVVGTLKNGISKAISGIKNFFGIGGSGSGIPSGLPNADPQTDPSVENFISQRYSSYSNKKFMVTGDKERVTVKDAGCAPAAATMVINSNPSYSPITMDQAIRDALEYKQPEGGVTADYFVDEFGKHGINSTFITNKHSNMKRNIIDHIRRGKQIVLMGSDPNNKSKRNSPFGPTDHYVVATGVNKDGTKLLINDPEARKAKIEYDTDTVLNKVKLGVIPNIKNKRKASNGILNKAKRALSRFSGKGPTRIIYVGDSRMVGMEKVAPGVQFIASVGSGLSWLKKQESRIKRYVDSGGSNPVVVFNHGVNDLYNRVGYGQYYTTLRARDWMKKAKMYFLSVNPIKRPCTSVTNADIASFNSYQSTRYRMFDGYIDTYSTLIATDFNAAQDGLHYTDATYKWIHEQIMSVLNGGRVSKNGPLSSRKGTTGNSASSSSSSGNSSNSSSDGSSSSSSGSSSSSSSSSSEEENKPVTPMSYLDDIDSNVTGISSFLSALDALAAAYGLSVLGSGSGDSSDGDSGSSDGGSTHYSKDGISGNVSSDKKIAEKQVEVIAKMKSIEGKNRYGQGNSSFPFTRNPDEGGGDCSSTVQWAYKNVTGVDVGSYTGAQESSPNTYYVDQPHETTLADESKLQLGDIILYGTNAGRHVELYYGDSRTIGHGGSTRSPFGVDSAGLGLGPFVAPITDQGNPWSVKRLNDFKSNGTSRFSADSSDEEETKEDSKDTKKNKQDKKTDKKKSSKDKGSKKDSKGGKGSGLPDFVSQLDSKYKNIQFGDETIAEAGCAPVVAAMAESAYSDSEQSPNLRTIIGRAKNYKAKGEGVTGDFFIDEFERSGYNSIITRQIDNIYNSLRKNKPVVLLGQDERNKSKRRSPFGPQAHYVLATGISEDGRTIYIHDPEARRGYIPYKTSSLENAIQFGIRPILRGANAKADTLMRTARSILSDITGSATKKKKEDVTKSKKVVSSKYGPQTPQYIVWNVLRANGYKEVATAAVMGNIEAECHFNVGAEEIGGGGGYGLIQWTGDRRTNLENFAASKGASPSDIKIQTEFLIQELKSGQWIDGGGPSYGFKSYNRSDWENAKEDTIDDATKAFMCCYERPDYDPGTNHWTERCKAARNYYNEFTGSTIDTSLNYGSSNSSTESSSKTTGSSSSSEPKILEMISMFDKLAKEYGLIDEVPESEGSSSGSSGAGSDSGGIVSGANGEEQTWNYFRSRGFTAEGTAGMMGNIQHESGFKFNNVENLLEKPDKLGTTDEKYTADVDSGAISKEQFLHPMGGTTQYGYGLVQWTSPGIKGEMYDYTKGKGKSIADPGGQMDCLYDQLKNQYSSLFNVFTTTDDIQEASNQMLHGYERPANQGPSVEIARGDAGRAIYQKYKDFPVLSGDGSTVDEDIDDSDESATDTSTSSSNSGSSNSSKSSSSSKSNSSKNSNKKLTSKYITTNVPTYSQIQASKKKHISSSNTLTGLSSGRTSSSNTKSYNGKRSSSSGLDRLHSNRGKGSGLLGPSNTSKNSRINRTIDFSKKGNKSLTIVGSEGISSIIEDTVATPGYSQYNQSNVTVKPTQVLSSNTNTKSLEALLKVLIKLLSQVVDNTSSINNISELMIKLLDIQTRLTEVSSGKGDTTDIKKDLLQTKALILNSIKRSNDEKSTDTIDQLIQNMESIAVQ